MLIVVTGPPAAGKTTWIKAHAKARDVVLDQDVITAAIAGPDAKPRDYSEATRDIAFRMRYAAVDAAVRHMADHDIYLIHSQPKPKHLTKYRRLGAKIVEINPGKDVVMERVRLMRSPAMVGAVTRWYAQRNKQQPTQRVGRQSSRRW